MQRRFDENPYPEGSDEAAIWDLLVKIPIEAFLKDDLSWGKTAIDEDFFFIDAGQHASPEGWRLRCRGRTDYLQFWREENAPLRKIDFAEDLRLALYRCAVVSQIEILHSTSNTTQPTTPATATAIARRMIVGGIAVKGGKAPLSLLPYKKMTMTLIQLQKKAGRWTLASMIASLPREEIVSPSTSTPPAEQDHAKNPSVDDSNTNKKKLDARILSSLPAIGPYSPVRDVPAGRLIAVSGQLGMTADGVSVGPDITSQTRQIMKNAEDALRVAHADLSDVFKTTVYITDLKHVKAFNEVYGEFFQEPQPARALLTSNLPKDFLVEVEFWAMR